MVLAPQDSQQHDNPPTLALAMAQARCAPFRAAFSSATIQKRARVYSPARRTTVAMAAGASPDNTAPRLDPKRATLFVCDVQEKFAPVIHGFDNCVHVASAMLRAGTLLDFPALVTEQVPDKLGKTVEALQPLLAGRTDVFVVGKNKRPLELQRLLHVVLQGRHQRRHALMSVARAALVPSRALGAWKQREELAAAALDHDLKIKVVVRVELVYSRRRRRRGRHTRSQLDEQ